VFLLLGNVYALVSHSTIFIRPKENFGRIMVWRSSVCLSVRPLATSCPLNILKSLRVTVMVLGRKIGPGQYMTPINSEVTRSKVKVTVPFNAKTMSAQYLEQLMSDSHGT